MSTINLRRAFVFVSALAVAFGATANETQDVLKAFSKMEARVETGVNFRDYTNALGDLNFEFKSYAESSAAVKQPEVKKALSAALFRYVYAAELWNLKFAGGPTTARIYPGTEAYKFLVTDYPDAVKDYAHGGAASDVLGGALNVDFLLPFLWSDAATSIHAAKAAANRGK